jgi:hypothetical protein
MSLIWAALIFVAGLSLGATLALLVVFLIATRIDDEPETLFEAGWDQ